MMLVQVGPFGLWRDNLFDRQFMIMEADQERSKDRPHVSARFVTILGLTYITFKMYSLISFFNR